MTCLVYVSFISESTFPHRFLLIRPAWGCFAGPQRFHKSLCDKPCDPIHWTNPGMMSFTQIYSLNPISTHYEIFLISVLNPGGCCTDSRSVIPAGRTGCVLCGKNSHVPLRQLFLWLLLFQKGECAYFWLSIKITTRWQLKKEFLKKSICSSTGVTQFFPSAGHIER